MVVVGAGGYGSIEAACAAAQSGDVIYVTQGSVTTGTLSLATSPIAGRGHLYLMSDANLSVTMGSNVQDLLLLGDSNINVLGNEMNNIIVGNAGNNRIDAGLGDDAIVGGTGWDTLLGNAGNDILIDGFGGQSTGQDALSGGSGNDVLMAVGMGSGGGRVVMTGGSGADVFRLEADGAPGEVTVDVRITDLNYLADSIDLSLLKISGLNTPMATDTALGSGSLNNGVLTFELDAFLLSDGSVAHDLSDGSKLETSGVTTQAVHRATNYDGISTVNTALSNLDPLLQNYGV